MLDYLAHLKERSEASLFLVRARRGFTLIELLVVIVILGVLMGSFAASTGAARENARIAKATAEARELGNAIRLFGITMMDASDSSSKSPLESLGLRDGLNEAPTDLTRMLTESNSSNGNTVYYKASDTSIRGNRLCDPWGKPYMIRVRKVQPTDVAKEDDYTILVPVPGRHRALKTSN